VPAAADAVVLRRRPGPQLSQGDLDLLQLPVRPPGPGEVVVRNLVTSVDPCRLRMLRGSGAVAPVAIGDTVPANSVGLVVQVFSRAPRTSASASSGSAAEAAGRRDPARRPVAGRCPVS
jgi:NADPH-dependent curcumin reductase CurA